jgi:NADPH-dependent 2,4-dienoyl-CoA reductase/sulfur reductase-like enzyme
MGIDIVYGAAKLTGKNTVQVGDRTLETRYVLLCTGSRPADPPIEGLHEAGFVTSENLFELEEIPASFVEIGGGPICVEMVQGFTRLGIPATLLQKGPRVLPRDEPALVDRLVDKLRTEGIDLRFNVNTEKVTVENGKKVVHGTENGKPATDPIAADLQRQVQPAVGAALHGLPIGRRPRAGRGRSAERRVVPALRSRPPLRVRRRGGRPERNRLANRFTIVHTCDLMDHQATLVVVT